MLSTEGLEKLITHRLVTLFVQPDKVAEVAFFFLGKRPEMDLFLTIVNT